MICFLSSARQAVTITALKIMNTSGDPNVNLPVSIDKINNIVQKETQMKKSGLTRYKYLLVIAEGLEAMKMGDIVEDNGNVRRGMIPDVARRQWAAEKAMLLFGDAIERKEIEHDLGDKTLERFRSLSVAELREKARELSEQLKTPLDIPVIKPGLARLNDSGVDDE